MAIILLGLCKCPICGNLLQEGEEIVGLPAISDLKNPLYEYFDQGFHQLCFEAWDKKDEIAVILRKEIQG